MLKWKPLLSLFLGLTLVFAQAGAVLAAHPQQDSTPITGTIQGVIVETSPESGLQTVVITLLVNNDTQVVRVSVATAIGFGLVIMGSDENPLVDESKFGTVVNIDPATILPEETSASEEQHPVGAKISEYFSNIFGVDYELVMSARSNGFGFGVISQSLWMTQKLGGDATLFQTILDAKKNHDYTDVALPDGTVPQNWGQLKKALIKGKDAENLGNIVSGAGEKQGNSANGNGNGELDDAKSNGNGKPENPGNGNGNNNRPETPPGQDKDKNKDDKSNNGNGKTK